jgi:hypothetical protein
MSDCGYGSQHSSAYLSLLVSYVEFPTLSPLTHQLQLASLFELNQLVTCEPSIHIPIAGRKKFLNMQLYRRRRRSRRSTPTPVRDSRFLSSLCSCRHGIKEEEALHSLPDYQHVSLNSSSSARLFYLSPSLGPEDVLEGSMTVVDFEDTFNIPSYYALSYTWVSAYQPHALRCEGSKISITCSLNSALQRLRRYIRYPTLIFADALCISQLKDSDAVQERSKQVKLMHRVFAQATQVIADLGEEADNSSIALTLLHKLCDIAQGNWETTLQESLSLVRAGTSIFDDESWVCLATLCKRRWFTRLWVVQEVALATDAVFLLGSVFVPTSLLFYGIIRAVSLIQYIAQHENGFGTEDELKRFTTLKTPMVDIVWRLDTIMSARNAPRVKIGELLWMTRLFDVTDPHDRIYSILGLVGGKVMADFTVDYSEPLTSLSARLNRIVIDQGGLAVALSLLACYGVSEMPSWRFDLGNLRGQAASRTWDTSEGTFRCLFRACKDTKPQLRWCPGADSILVLRGSNMGQVVAVSDDLMIPSHTPIRLYYHILLWNRELLKMARLHMKNIPPDVVQDLLITAVVANGRTSRWAPQKLCDCLQAASSVVNVGPGRWTWAKAVRTWWHVRPWERPGFYEGLIEYQDALRGFCERRVVCITDRAQIGVMQKGAKPGDEIAIFTGCPEPFLVRKRNGTYQIIGPVYLHGWMDGNALESELWYEEDFYIS